MANGAGIDSRDIKILILAIMSELPQAAEYGKTTEILALSIGLSNMDITEYISNLAAAGLLETYRCGGETYLCITEQGMSAADDAVQGIRYIDVDSVMHRALCEYDRIVRELRYCAEINPSDEDGGCTVDYICTEHGRMRCRISVFYDSFDLADAALGRIENDPSYFRRYIEMYLNRE